MNSPYYLINNHIIPYWNPSNLFVTLKFAANELKVNKYRCMSSYRKLHCVTCKVKHYLANIYIKIVFFRVVYPYADDVYNLNNAGDNGSLRNPSSTTGFTS